MDSDGVQETRVPGGILTTTSTPANHQMASNSDFFRGLARFLSRTRPIPTRGPWPPNHSLPLRGSYTTAGSPIDPTIQVNHLLSSIRGLQTPNVTECASHDPSPNRRARTSTKRPTQSDDARKPAT